MNYTFNIPSETYKAAINYAIDQLDTLITDEREIYYSDLHHELFNMDYAFIYYGDAEEFIEQAGGAFTVIDIIKSYETDNFGEIYTDISDACKVANMLNYILGEEVLAQNSAYEDFRDFEVLNAENLDAIRNEFIAMTESINA